MEEWKKVKLGEIVNVLDYKRIPLSSAERSRRKGEYPYYGAQGIIDYVDNYIFDGTYLLIAEDGENLKSQKQNIAQIVTGKYWVNNHAHIVESNGLCDIRYVCFLLNIIDLSGYITGSAQPKLNQANLLNIVLQLPTLPRQKQIADYIGTINDKIELNRRINDNLEQQAQALFKSWFVDFEPWGGKMPDDWREGTLLDIADYVNGLAMQKFPSKDGCASLPVLKIKELGQGYCDDASDRCTSTISSQYIVDDGDVIFSWSGTLLVDIWCGGTCGLNQHLYKVTSKSYPKWFYLYWTLFHLEEFRRIASDKAVTMGHIKRGDLKKAKVFIPSNTTMAVLSNQITSMIENIINVRKENVKLAQLRDTILPRLMSGELKIS